MATFYVGQRVRLARDCAPENLGIEGVIDHFDTGRVGDNCRDGGILESDCDCGVSWDREAGTAWESTSRLEPIQPEGHKTVEWTECLWQPEHLREVA